MKEYAETPTQAAPAETAKPKPANRSLTGRIRGVIADALAAHPAFSIYIAILTICFAKALYDLIAFALHSDVFSHILLIPFISLYLAFQRKDHGPSTTDHRPTAPPTHRRTAPPLPRPLAFIPFTLGLAALVAFFLLRPSLISNPSSVIPNPSSVIPNPSSAIPSPTALALTTSAFLCFVWAGAIYFLDRGTLRRNVFPFSFLVFMVPFPVFVTDWLEIFLQHGSAVAADFCLRLSGLPFLRDGQVFKVPGIVIKVAQECSGIRSSLVLFITSLLAAYLFLDKNWKRMVFVFAVLPLGILRNGFRIMTISLLCAYISPQMIDSPIHHQGGPIFFVLSLIPLFLLLWVLRGRKKWRPQDN